MLSYRNRKPSLLNRNDLHMPCEIWIYLNEMISEDWFLHLAISASLPLSASEFHHNNSSKEQYCWQRDVGYCRFGFCCVFFIERFPQSVTHVCTRKLTGGKFASKKFTQWLPSLFNIVNKKPFCTNNGLNSLIVLAILFSEEGCSFWVRTPENRSVHGMKVRPIVGPPKSDLHIEWPVFNELALPLPALQPLALRSLQLWV